MSLMTSRPRRRSQKTYPKNNFLLLKYTMVHLGQRTSRNGYHRQVGSRVSANQAGVGRRATPVEGAAPWAYGRSGGGVNLATNVEPAPTFNLQRANQRHNATGLSTSSLNHRPNDQNQSKRHAVRGYRL